ncbi:hypothetical protein D1007_20922 [Hordeum vulgare]|nr:hypothetical protein D1007_20922 [Hordeum vulgare]
MESSHENSPYAPSASHTSLYTPLSCCRYLGTGTFRWPSSTSRGTIWAYQYSSITSITLLGYWTVVWVIILTWYALGTRYSFWQFLGPGTCMAGLALVLLSDAKSPDEQDAGLHSLKVGFTGAPPPQPCQDGSGAMPVGEVGV